MLLRSTILLFLAQYIAGDQVPICDPGFTLMFTKTSATPDYKCLKLFAHPETHSQAAHQCQNYYGTLATIKSKEENSAITRIAGTDAPLVWIGLYCFGNDVSQCYWDDFSGPVSSSYNNFAPGFPNTDIGNCVYYSDHGSLEGKWVSGNCQTLTKAYVCELPPTFADPTCDGYNYNGHCYTLHNPLPFKEAQAACEQECGNLVSITSPLENFFVSQKTGQTMFIGASYATPDVLNWLDGSQNTYTNFDPSTTLTSNCLVLFQGTTGTSLPGLWYGSDCQTPQNFMCKRPVGTGKCNPPATVSPAPSNPSHCNGDLLVAPGFISSPNYPYNYGNNTSCTYRISTLGSYNVLLRFVSFTTEQKHDFVTVYDGDSVDARQLGSYSGHLQPFSVVATGSTMTVTFKSDGSNVAQGFQARFTSYSYGR